MQNILDEEIKGTTPLLSSLPLFMKVVHGIIISLVGLNLLLQAYEPVRLWLQTIVPYGVLIFITLLRQVRGERTNQLLVACFLLLGRYIIGVGATTFANGFLNWVVGPIGIVPPDPSS